jgi:hypothetical protein
VIHSIFDRPREILKTFGPNGYAAAIKAEGDTWGANPQLYGFEGWCPPGHYVLGAVQRFLDAEGKWAPIAGEGFGQIPVLDMGDDVANQLVAAGKATWSGQLLVIGGVPGRIGQLARFGRSAIMVHCGGSNADDPYADHQELCKTYGCTRTYNLEWREYADYLDKNRAGNTVVYSIVGDPVRLAR